MKQASERRIWKTGKGSYVTSLPKEWANNLKNGRITISEYKDGLFLMPLEARKRKKAKLKFDRNDPNMLKYEIISAYLNNYREIQIEFQKPFKQCIVTLESLPKKLLGVSVSFVSSNSFLVSMSTMLKPIPEILEQMLLQGRAIQETNQKTMLTFNLSEDQVERVKAIENDIDRNSFLVKRLFSVAATQPSMAREVGIDDLSQVVHWETLNSNLERIGDIQLAICQELDGLLKNLGKNEIKNIMHLDELNYGFRSYHNAAQEMVNDAYSNDLEKITEVINTKRQNFGNERIRYRGKYITKEEGRAIRKLVTDNPDLTCLDVRIWGLTGSATNIAEAWLNMRGPTTLELNK